MRIYMQLWHAHQQAQHERGVAWPAGSVQTITEDVFFIIYAQMEIESLDLTTRVTYAWNKYRGIQDEHFSEAENEKNQVGYAAIYKAEHDKFWARNEASVRKQEEGMSDKDKERSRAETERIKKMMRVANEQAAHRAEQKNKQREADDQAILAMEVAAMNVNDSK